MLAKPCSGGSSCNAHQGCNDAIVSDTDLLQLRVELMDRSRANIPGDIPRLHSSFESLVEFLATIIFQSSAQHSAVNNGQVRGH